MRLGLNFGYWGSGPSDNIAIAQEAERLGYHSLWTAEAYGSDSVSPLVWLAAHTERINVGTAIMQMPARTPAMTAMTAATIDLLTGGRFMLNNVTYSTAHIYVHPTYQGDSSQETEGDVDLCIFELNKDVPGVIGQVGTILGKHQINIGDFSLGRDETSGGKVREAIAVVHVDSPVGEAVLEELRKMDAVKEARAIRLF